MTRLICVTSWIKLKSIVEQRKSKINVHKLISHIMIKVSRGDHWAGFWNGRRQEGIVWSGRNVLFLALGGSCIDIYIKCMCKNCPSIQLRTYFL
jgi:hypothetical protein